MFKFSFIWFRWYVYKWIMLIHDYANRVSYINQLKHFRNSNLATLKIWKPKKSKQRFSKPMLKNQETLSFSTKPKTDNFLCNKE